MSEPRKKRVAPDLIPSQSVESVPSNSEAIAPKLKPKGKYPTEFYRSIGLTVCEFCGEKEGIVCPESKHDCPMLAAKTSFAMPNIQAIAYLKICLLLINLGEIYE